MLSNFAFHNFFAWAFLLLKNLMCDYQNLPTNVAPSNIPELL